MLLTGACNMDTDASQVDLGFVAFVDQVCSSAEFQLSQYNRFFSNFPDNKRIPIEEDLKRVNDRCDALRPITEGSKDTYQELLDGIWTPRVVYLFELIDGTGAESFTWIAGYFDDLDSCKVHKAAVESAGYRTNDCYTRTLFWHAAWA